MGVKAGLMEDESVELWLVRMRVVMVVMVVMREFGLGKPRGEIQ